MLDQQIPPNTDDNRVSAERINYLIDNAQIEEHVFFGKVLVREYLLPNGFTIQGRGACVDPTNFSLEKGREVADENAKNKLWELEGYLLQERLSGIK